MFKKKTPVARLRLVSLARYESPYCEKFMLKRRQEEPSTSSVRCTCDCHQTQQAPEETGTAFSVLSGCENIYPEERLFSVLAEWRRNYAYEVETTARHGNLFDEQVFEPWFAKKMFINLHRVHYQECASDSTLQELVLHTLNIADEDWTEAFFNLFERTMLQGRCNSHATPKAKPFGGKWVIHSGSHGKYDVSEGQLLRNDTDEDDGRNPL